MYKKRLLGRFYFKSSNPLSPDLYVSRVEIVKDYNGKQKLISYFDRSCEEIAWTSKLQWAKSVADKNEAIILYDNMRANEHPVKLVRRWWCLGWHEMEVA